MAISFFYVFVLKQVSKFNDCAMWNDTECVIKNFEVQYIAISTVKTVAEKKFNRKQT